MREKGKDHVDAALLGTNPFRSDLLEGSTALITGGGTGLGRGIALALAACGARIAVTGRRRAVLEEVVELIRDGGGRAEAQECNIRDSAAVQAMVESLESKLGPISRLVNNAGATFNAPALDLTANGFKAVVETDTLGTFNVSQAVGRRLVHHGIGGSILNITSTSIPVGNPGRIHGGVGKAGVESLTKSLAVEWGVHGIRTNALAPGYTPTSGVNNATGLDQDPGEHLARLSALVPLGRVGTIRDIAWPAAFLLSPAASFINGAVLYADGGKWLSSGRGGQAADGLPVPS
jgi:NAD(P)-dependent dehydrogenase (short-subunit alcohol dehydrogenase family)